MMDPKEHVAHTGARVPPQVKNGHSALPPAPHTKPSTRNRYSKRPIPLAYFDIRDELLEAQFCDGDNEIDATTDLLSSFRRGRPLSDYDEERGQLIENELTRRLNEKARARVREKDNVFNFEARQRANGHAPPGAAQPSGGEQKAPPSQRNEPLSYVDMSTWDDTRAAPQEWLIDSRIPLLQPTLFSGAGGVGKTILLQQLIVSIAANGPNVDFIGFMPTIATRSGVLFVSTEETTNKVQERFEPMLEHYKLKFRDLVANGLQLLSFPVEDAALPLLGALHMERGGVLHIEPTDLYQRIYRDVQQSKPRLIVVENIADVYGGNENDRQQVTQFMRLMRKLAFDAGAALILSAHPSVSGMRSGSGTSGTTQWHNCCKARAYVTDSADDEDDDDGGASEADDGRRKISFMKNNYGRKAEPIQLQFDPKLRMFMPVATAGQTIFQAAKVEQLFLTLLARFTEQGRFVSPGFCRTYAPTVFADHEEAKKALGGKEERRRKALASAMGTLLDQRRIRIATDGPPSRRRTFLAVAG